MSPDRDSAWLLPSATEDFKLHTPIGHRGAGKRQATRQIFDICTLGVSTNRDAVVYDFGRAQLERRIKRFIDTYNSEVDRYKRSDKPSNVDDFVEYESIKWSRDLKQDLVRLRYATYSDTKVRSSLYRPFCRQVLFFDSILNEEIYLLPRVFPAHNTENTVLCCTNHSQVPFSCQITDVIPNQAVGGRGGQTFPFYTYNEDGSNRRENITDWALEEFRKHYDDKKISKWDIFYYVYGILHHPGYREKFGDNLKRELPRIPFAPDFRAFADAGKELARLHLDYEKLKPYPLEFVETPDVPLSYRVEDKMRLNKTKTELKVNPSLALRGIPEKCFDYRLGNRSALDWVINQYQVIEHKRSSIKSDPNREDDPEYIVRLVGQVIHVSLETVRIVESLPKAYS